MNFADWEPVYEAVLADFGYDRAADERARDVLAALVGSAGGGIGQSGDPVAPAGAPAHATADGADRETTDDRGNGTADGTPDDPTNGTTDDPADGPARGPVDHLPALDGATVAVVGAGPSLPAEVDRARDADVVVAGSTAADHLLDRGVAVDALVTDLDGTPRTARDLVAGGVPVVVHAHGDNVAPLRAHVPAMVRAGGALLPTTQAAPRGAVRNFGGFTDGDRSAFLADHFGAAGLVFPGWDFDDPDVAAEKRRKLAWAERLLYWLERRRGERFGVLDGRRGGIDTSALPASKS